jgi:hypothetical protein
MKPFFSLLILLFIASIPATTLAQYAIEDFVDPLDRQYLRIKSVYKDKYLSHIEGQEFAIYHETADVRDLNTHWYISLSPEPDQYWIRNRSTGQSLHIENQTGQLEIASVEETYTSHRWFFESETDLTRIRNAWQADQYITVEDHIDQAVQTSELQEAFLSQRFQLEPIPRGASTPWIRYDERNVIAVTAPGEILQQSYTAALDRNAPTAEAHHGGCILLNDYGTAAEWTAQEAADALTLRYSLLDGESGNITLSIIPFDSSPTRSQSITLDTAQAWVYFEGGEEHNSPASGRIPAKRFADARIRLSNTIQAGDTIRLSREAGDNLIWIDCIDAETSTTSSATNLANAYDVTAAPWNAVGDGVTDDTSALQTCINAASSAGKSVFLPAGRYNLQAEIVLPSNTIVEGAGFWHTEIFFSQAGSSQDGGIRGNGSNIECRNLYISGSQTERNGGYHGIKGIWAGQSIIEQVWIENTTTGMWIADLNSPYGVADGLLIRNCRIHNTFADGINLASGTRNTVIENCHLRSTGDDALASWSSGYSNNLGMTQNNRIRYNTVECGYRAGALAVFGGQGHRIHHNLVEDQYIGAGIRGSSLFFFTNGTGGTRVGYEFSDSEPMRIYANTLRRTGARGLFGQELAAIDFQTGYGDVTSLIIEAITVEGSHFSGIRFNGAFVNSTPAPEFESVSVRSIQMSDVPIGTRITGSALGAASFEAITLTPANTPEFINETSTFMIHELGSQIQFTPSGADTAIEESGTNDSYAVVLISAPTENVTVTISPDSQLSSSSPELTFTPANWNSPQYVTLAAIDDSIEEGTHSGSVQHSAISIDSRFTASVLPDIDAIITDNDQNQAPTITFTTPTRVALPTNVGLLLKASIADDYKPSGAALSAQWTTIEQPNGSIVKFDDPSAANTGVHFDLTGTYILQLTANDSTLSTSAELTVYYGADEGRILLNGTDIGTVGINGNLDENNGLYTVSGSGYDVWNGTDECFFFNAPFQGDGSISIRLLSQTNTFQWAKAGLMIRDSLDPDSSHALLAVTPENGMAFQNRPTTSALSNHNDAGAYSFPEWLKLERIGTTITAFRSSDGINWNPLGSTNPVMSGNDHIGMFITCHNNGALSEATFDHLEENVLGLAPSVDAGTTSTVRIGDTITLSGSAADDGLPQPATLSTEWLQLNGPGTLSFGTPSALNSSVSSDTAGDYTLRLIADDGELQSYQDLAFTTLTGYEAWQMDTFGSIDAVNAAFSADPDNDQFNNLYEYAFGGNPMAAENPTFIRPFGTTQPHNGKTYFELSYRRLVNPYSGISYTVQVSTSLTPNSWQTGAAYFEEVGPSDDNNDGTETVTIRLLENTEDAPTQFVRVLVESL